MDTVFPLFEFWKGLVVKVEGWSGDAKALLYLFVSSPPWFTSDQGNMSSSGELQYTDMFTLNAKYCSIDIFTALYLDLVINM